MANKTKERNKDRGRYGAIFEVLRTERAVAKGAATSRVKDNFVSFDFAK